MRQEPAEEPKHSRTRVRLHAWRERLHGHRETIRAKPTLNKTYRVVLGAFGAIVLIAGILMIPYPGPGWLVVFAGLGILATEFHWAHRVNMFAKRHYHSWMNWLHRQHFATKLLLMSATGIVVVLTLWCFGLFALFGQLFHLHWPWLSSPLFGP